MPEAVQYKGDTGQLYEQPDSPAWDFSTRAGASQKFRGLYSLCLSSAPSAGALGTGDFAGMVVAGSSVQHEKGGLGTLTIKYEPGPGTTVGGRTQVPPDVASIKWKPEEFKLEEHPRYTSLTQSQRDAVDTALKSTTDEERQKALKKVNASTLAQKLYDKCRAGEDHFGLSFPIYTWTLYFIDEPLADSGGYPDDPFGPLGVPLGFDYLREPDEVDVDGQFFKLTRTWRSGFNIDTDVYPVFQ